MPRPIRSHRRSLPALVFSLAALLSFSVAPAVARAEPVFQFTGRGYGHGIGMSQWGAKGMADAGWDYRRILGHYYQGSWVAPWTGTTGIRVNVDPSVTPNTSKYLHSSWTLGPGHGASSQLRVAFGGNTYLGAAGHVYRFEPNVTGSGATRIWDTTTNSQWLVGATGLIPAGTTAVVDETAGGPTLTQVFDPSGYGNLANKKYRGTLEVTNNGSGKLKLVNSLGVEGYIYGVIPLETGYTWGEATKAQAVAARGYALTSSGELYCTTYSQVYGGYNSEQALSNAAADATYGQVVFANDPHTTSNPVAIRTYFFSASGGHTENVENVWGSGAEPYYVGVDDPYEFAAGTSGHIWSSQPAWTGTVVRSKLVSAKVITAGGTNDPGTLQDIVVTKRGVSGRVMTLELRGTTRTVQVSGNSFKSAMGWGDTWFYVTRFDWDLSSAQVAPGGSVSVPFNVSPPVTVDIKGVMKDGVDTGVILHAVNGRGTLTITQPGTYWVDGTIYARTTTGDDPDPTQGDLRGSDRLFRNGTNRLTVTLGAAPSGTTSLTIKTSATSVYWGRPFVLSGVLTPGAVGDPVVVYVKKPGKTYWSYSSKRLCYSAAAAGGANWWYRYTPIGRTSPRGTYYFKTAFSGDAARTPVVSATVKVTVR